MKSWASGGMLAATIALPALSGVAWAHDFACSNATLQGEYAFGVTNFNAPQIHVAAGIKFFDGNGNLIQHDYRGNTSPVELSGEETGTYQVSSDCSGTLTTQTAGGSVVVLFVISDGGRHIHEVVASLTPPGSTQSVPVQTSADDWKVAPEQNQQQ
jgi:hypothetical protein